MSKANPTENDLLNLFFQGTALPWNAITNLFIALHTADPGEAGNQSTSEASYTGYARVSVARTSGGWTVAGGSAQNAALIQFPQCTGGSSNVTHVSIGTQSTGAGQILYSGPLNAALNITNLIQPQFAAGALVVTED